MNKGNQIFHAKQYFDELQYVFARLAHDPINQIAETLIKAYESEQTAYLFGNGGSASLASHFACDLGKGTAYCNGGKRFRVLALTDNLPTLTAWANDSGYEDVFSEQLRNFVQPRDVMFAISASGNSKNVLNAVHVGREAGAIAVGISGFEGGQLKLICDTCVVVPSNNMQIIEDVHLAISHSIYRIVHSRITRRSLAASCPA
ncbi:MAG TPA: SIS domain-containing protein [Chthoniobacterales bacterium]|nr:SIS domain-containing protein [Chthoniobacterales bacterium]